MSQVFRLFFCGPVTTAVLDVGLPDPVRQRCRETPKSSENFIWDAALSSATLAAPRRKLQGIISYNIRTETPSSVNTPDVTKTPHRSGRALHNPKFWRANPTIYFEKSPVSPLVKNLMEIVRSHFEVVQKHALKFLWVLSIVDSY